MFLSIFWHFFKGIRVNFGTNHHLINFVSKEWYMYTAMSCLPNIEACCVHVLPLFCQNKHYVAMLGYHLREACLVTYLSECAMVMLCCLSRSIL